jgi:hypothetical protein
MGDAYSTHEDETDARSFAEKPRGKRQIGRPRRRSEDDIKMYLRNTGLKVSIGFIWFLKGNGNELLSRR